MTENFSFHEIMSLFVWDDLLFHGIFDNYFFKGALKSKNIMYLITFIEFVLLYFISYVT